MKYLLMSVLTLGVPVYMHACEEQKVLNDVQALVHVHLSDKETIICDMLNDDLMLVRDIAHTSLEVLDCSSVYPRTVVATRRYSCYRAYDYLRFFIDEADNNRLVIINLTLKKAKRMFDECSSLEPRFRVLAVQRTGAEELFSEVQLYRIDWRNS